MRSLSWQLLKLKTFSTANCCETFYNFSLVWAGSRAHIVCGLTRSLCGLYLISIYWPHLLWHIVKYLHPIHSQSFFYCFGEVIAAVSWLYCVNPGRCQMKTPRSGVLFPRFSLIMPTIIRNLHRTVQLFGIASRSLALLGPTREYKFDLWTLGGLALRN